MPAFVLSRRRSPVHRDGLYSNRLATEGAAPGRVTDQPIAPRDDREEISEATVEGFHTPPPA